MDLTKIIDKRFFTLLHISCLNNLFDLLEFLIIREKENQALNEIQKKEKILTWINKKTDEGFTAIHFASFRGNLKMIKFLEENGSDINAVNY